MTQPQSRGSCPALPCALGRAALPLPCVSTFLPWRRPPTPSPAPPRETRGQQHQLPSLLPKPAPPQGTVERHSHTATWGWQRRGAAPTPTGLCGEATGSRLCLWKPTQHRPSGKASSYGHPLSPSAPPPQGRKQRRKPRPGRENGAPQRTAAEQGAGFRRPLVTSLQPPSSTTERVCSAQDRVRCSRTLSKVTRLSGGRAGPSPGSVTQGQHRAPGHTTPAAVFKAQSQG